MTNLSYASVDICGVRVLSITRNQLETVVMDALRDGHGGSILTVNLETIRRSRTDPDLRALCARSDVAVADGMPLLWAAQAVGAPLPERVTGSDLVFTLPRRAASEGRSVFLLGGADGAADAAAAALIERNPALRVVGTACPKVGFERSPSAMDRLRSQLAEAGPDIVIVGLGFPKQDHVIEALRSTLPLAWFLGCGISIEFAAGYVQRAPRWMHVTGLEWIYRLTREPRKLMRRYLIHGIPFAIRLAAWSARTRLRRHHAS